jgi:hypothetical protein
MDDLKRRETFLKRYILEEIDKGKLNAEREKEDIVMTTMNTVQNIIRVIIKI